MGKRAKAPSKRTAAKTEKHDSPPELDFDELRQLADRGDPTAQAELRKLLDDHPEIWRQVGDLAVHAQLEFVRLIAKNDFLLTESIQRRAAEMRRELAGAFPTPVELLMVERVVACWLQVQYVESQIALADGELLKARFWLQRQMQANRLYHAATKALMLVREVLPPAAPPAALAADAAGETVVQRNGRRVGMNRVSRISTTHRNGKCRELATV